MIEQIIDRFVVVSPLDRLSDERSDRELCELERKLRGIEARTERNRVRHHKFVELVLRHEALLALRREREVRDERMDGLRAIVAKQRTGGDTVDAFSVVGDVSGCDVIMIDDMTATGGTLSAAAKMCRDNGAKSVHAFVSHFPLTPKGADRLMTEGYLDELVVTDSIKMREGFDPSKLPFKLTQLSVAPLIGEAIKRTHNDESINDLFNHE